MEFTTLGRTDLRVSRLTFGCEVLGGYDWGKVDDKDSIAAVRQALELGINFFDTADVYGLGRSEELLSKALGSQRHKVVIATKFGVNWSSVASEGRAKTFLDASPKRVVEALEGSLKRLRIDSVALYQVHWPDPSVPAADTMQALLRCKEEGKIQHIGYANGTPEILNESAGVHRVETLQSLYNLAQREIENGTIGYCERECIGILAYGPLAQGLLTGKYDRHSTFSKDDRRHRLDHFQGAELERCLRLVGRLKEVARKYEKSPAQVAIRWILDQPSISTAIVGMKTPAQAVENAGAVGWSLSENDLGYLGA